jgi:hypothetical protein
MARGLAKPGIVIKNAVIPKPRYNVTPAIIQCLFVGASLLPER